MFDSFPSSVRHILSEQLGDRPISGRIPASVVEAILKNIQGDETAVFQGVLRSFLSLAQELSRPAVSKFIVGAVAVGESGDLYLGANLEFAGIGLENSLHAEQSAVNNAFLHDEQGISQLAISALPCGHCRQFLAEMANAEELNILVGGQAPKLLTHYLPNAFSPSELSPQSGLFSNRKTACYEHEKETENLGLVSAFHKSYAPHTNCHSAIELHDGNTSYLGRYIENVAYNPSLPPLLSALDKMRTSGAAHSDIKKATLIERPEAIVSHRKSTKALLDQLAPNAELEFITAPA